jgi:seryl-tRNA synthetase
MATADSDSITTACSLERPADSAGSIDTGLAVQQRARETALEALARLRKEAKTEIDRLIGFLDASDQYASTELEDSGDDEAIDDEELEPELTPGEAKDQTKLWSRWPKVDDEVTDGEDDDESEPSLGSSTAHDQTYWARGPRDDREFDEVEKLEAGDEDIYDVIEA